MTAQDYRTIANAIRATRATYRTSYAEHHDPLDAVTCSIASHLSADNPRFDYNRFLDACEVPSFKTYLRKEPSNV